MLKFLLNNVFMIKSLQEFLMKNFLAKFQCLRRKFWAQKTNVSDKMTKIGSYTEKISN